LFLLLGTDMSEREYWEEEGEGEEGARDSELRDAACFLLLVGLCVLLAFVTTTFPNHRRNCELVGKVSDLKEESLDLHQRNKYLRAEIVALQTDARYVEAVARRKLKMVRNGETILEVPGESRPE
jgi:cell division protein FtsB